MALNTVVPVVMARGFVPGAAGTTQYTVPAGKSAVVKDLWIANTDSVAHPVTLRIVPSGQATSDTYAIVPGLVLGPKGSAGSVFQAGCSTNMLAGDFVDVYTDAASKVTCRFSGVEVS